jgi:GntR family transcriptional regulator, arabinose operon transcriptional repressor
MNQMQVNVVSLDLSQGRYDRTVQPKHERLREHLVKQILTGRLRPGQMMPSDRRLMESLGVARTTVRQAMASLENEGLIRRVQGKGTFVGDDVRRKLRHGLDIFALIVPEMHGGFYPSLLRGFETAAGEIRHRAVVCSTADDVDRQANIILQLLDQKVGGVAINPTDPEPTPGYQIRQIQERGVPVVFCHHRVEGISAPLLAIPYLEVGRLAGKTFLERGHRCVAYLGGPRCPESDAYEQGLREVMESAGGNVLFRAESYTNEKNQPDEDTCWAALQRVFSGSERPTALFVSFDREAEIIYLLLPRLGLRVPEDVSLLGFGGAWREGAVTRRLNSIVVDEIDTGRRAVALLHEMREGDRPIDDNEEFTLKLNLSRGETLGAIGDA